jgi:hypothetical protein
MKNIDELKKTRISIKNYKEGDGGWAICYLPPEKKEIKVVFSFGDGWDHISASFVHRCLTWEEMCRIKDIFFHEDEIVLQYHPAKKDYVNLHPYVLHLWRPQNQDIPIPDKIMV